MRLVLLTGGEGADLAHALSALFSVDDSLDVVVPVTRDLWGHGLKVCPDVDAFLAAQSGAGSTFAVADELAAIGFLPAWMRPSDADVARRLVRTELLQAGYTLGDATAAMATRASLPFGLHPVSDDRAELHVVVEEPNGRRAGTSRSTSPIRRPIERSTPRSSRRRGRCRHRSARSSPRRTSSCSARPPRSSGSTRCSPPQDSSTSSRHRCSESIVPNPKPCRQPPSRTMRPRSSPPHATLWEPAHESGPPARPAPWHPARPFLPTTTTPPVNESS